MSIDINDELDALAEVDIVTPGRRKVESLLSRAGSIKLSLINGFVRRLRITAFLLVISKLASAMPTQSHCN